MAMNDYSDNDYWKALAERFFEAGTSEEEERELRRFIASGLAGSEFNDVRAVMGLAAVGARRYNRRRRRTVFLSAEFCAGWLESGSSSGAEALGFIPYWIGTVRVKVEPLPY